MYQERNFNHENVTVSWISLEKYHCPPLSLSPPRSKGPVKWNPTFSVAREKGLCMLVLP